jgi:signal peptidase I
MNKRLFRLKNPERWDVVVFRRVNERTRHKRLIKRIVGLPGERIQIADGVVHVNGEPATPPDELKGVLHYTTQLEPDDDMVATFLLSRALDNKLPWGLNVQHPDSQAYMEGVRKLRERLAGMDITGLDEDDRAALLRDVDAVTKSVARQALRLSFEPPSYGVQEEDEYSVVPEDCYLVLGDNSGQSVDGRFFGWLPNDRIIGRTFCIWWPVSRWRDLTGFSQTWWGRGLLIGVPGLFLLFFLYELSASHLIRSMKVRNNGLAPSVAAGEYVLINCTAFGFRIPFLGIQLPTSRFPRPGGLVAFIAESETDRALALSRLAGLPGARIRIEDQKIRIGRDEFPIWAEKNGGFTPAEWCSKRTAVIPDGHCLILSDKPKEAPDSRRFGWIPHGNLVGSAILVWWPLTRVRRIRRAGQVGGKKAGTEHGA